MRRVSYALGAAALSAALVMTGVVAQARIPHKPPAEESRCARRST